MFKDFVQRSNDRVNVRRLLVDKILLEERIKTLVKQGKEFEHIKSTRTYKVLRAIGLLK